MLAIAISTQGASTLNGNPFSVKPYYVQMSLKHTAHSTAKTLLEMSGSKDDPATVAAIEKAYVKIRNLGDVPSAFWVDTKAKIFISYGGSQTVEGILKDAAYHERPQLVVFILYNLPNRDCHAKVLQGGSPHRSLSRIISR